MPYVRSLGKKNAEGKRVGPPYQCVYRDASGARHSKAGFPTKTQARMWGEQQEAQARSGQHVAPRAGRERLGDWEKRWWDSRVGERTTLATDRYRLDKHVLPRWKDWPLDAITHVDVQGWAKALVADGLAPATARSCVALLSSMLRSAMRSGLIPNNQAEGIDLPTSPKRPHRYMTREEVDLLVTELAAPYDLMCLTAAYTGLRWGELAGLHGTRVDLLRRSIEVVETLTEVSGRFEVKAYPKTSKSRRTVPLTQRLADALAAHITDRDDLIFRGPTGAPISRTRCSSRHWKPTILRLNAAAEEADLKPPIHTPLPRWHDLRHTYASWLVQDGVNLYTVQERMGHSSYATTTLYAHLRPDANDDVLEALEGKGKGRLTSEL